MEEANERKEPQVRRRNTLVAAPSLAPRRLAIIAVSNDRRVLIPETWLILPTYDRRLVLEEEGEEDVGKKRIMIRGRKGGDGKGGC